MAGRRTPSLEAIEAFLLAAEVGSFQEAAERIALSPSAFSRRIQTLEALVGRPLFDRSGSSPRITASGRAYAREIEPLMDQIARATSRLRDHPPAETIRVITSHALAVSWVIPKLADLHAQTGITVDLDIGRSAGRLRSGDIDLAIWGGADDGRDYECDHLASLRGLPISSSRLSDGRRPPATLEDLREHRLLRARNAPDLWTGWFEGVGVSPTQFKYAEIDNTHLVYEGAAGGIGVAIAVPMLADRVIAEREVRPCFEQQVDVPIHYHIIYSQDGLRRRADVRRLRDWLRQEAAGSFAAFDKWASASSVC